MPLSIIDQKIISATVERAKKSPRKRVNHNFHAVFEDPINRMLNAMEPGTYVRPHKHESPDKREIFIVLSGSMAVVIFDDQGNIIEDMTLDPKIGSHGVEIPERVWHTVLPLETGSVVYEIKDGPYAPINDKNFASWAPAEGSPECASYLQNLMSKLQDRRQARPSQGLRHTDCHRGATPLGKCSLGA